MLVVRFDPNDDAIFKIAETIVMICAPAPISTNKLLLYLLIKQKIPQDIPEYKNKLLNLLDFNINDIASFNSVKYCFIVCCFLFDCLTLIFSISSNPKDRIVASIVNINEIIIGIYGLITYKNPESTELTALNKK